MTEPMFREAQYMSGWVVAVLAFVGLAMPALLVWLSGLTITRVRGRIHVAATRLTAGVCAATAAAIVLFFGVMTTEVTPAGVRVVFGFVASHDETVPAADILGATAVRYDPMSYNGWGIRGRGPADRVLSMDGDRAAQLDLTGGRTLKIGSRRPDELAAAIMAAGR